MKIVFIIDSIGSGGAQRLLINIAKGLSKKYQTKIILYNQVSDIDSKEISEIFTKKLNSNQLKGLSIKTIFKIREEIRDSNLLISFMPSSNIYCSISKLFLNNIYHIACEVSTKNIVEGKLKRLIANFSNYFSNKIVCNTYMQADYIGKFPGMKNKVLTIWNGCENINFKQRERRIKEDLKFIIVGRVAYPKNGFRFLKGLKLFYEKYKYLPFIKWIGRRDLSDKWNIEINEKMDNFLKKHKYIAERFSFVGEKKNIINEYSKSDGIILPSIYEGLPYVICEAMLNGTPIMASKVGDNNIILGEKEERGILFDPYSEKEISEKLNIFISLKNKKIEKMTHNARKFAEKHFMVENMLSSYEKIIDTLN